MMTGVTPAVARRKEVRVRTKTETDAHTSEEEFIGLPAADLKRPNVLESHTFSKQLEVALAYADSELNIVRANLAALTHRENDLMRIRDSALMALGKLNDTEPGYENGAN